MSLCPFLAERADGQCPTSPGPQEVCLSSSNIRGGELLLRAVRVSFHITQPNLCHGHQQTTGRIVFDSLHVPKSLPWFSFSPSQAQCSPAPTPCSPPTPCPLSPGGELSLPREHGDLAGLNQVLDDLGLIVGVMDPRLPELSRVAVLLPIVVPVSPAVSAKPKHIHLRCQIIHRNHCPVHNQHIRACV